MGGQPTIYYICSGNIYDTCSGDRIEKKTCNLIITYFLFSFLCRSYLSSRIFFATLSLLGCVTAFSFSGSLVSFLTVTTYPELDHTIVSLFDWGGNLGTTGGYGSNTYRFIASSKNPKIKLLAAQYQPVSHWQEGFSRALEGDYAYMSSKISSDFTIQTQLTNM